MMQQHRRRPYSLILFLQEIVDKTMELKQSPETFDRFFQQFNGTNLTRSGKGTNTSIPSSAGVPPETEEEVPEQGRDLLEMKPSCPSRTEIIPRFSRARNVLGKWVYLIDGSSGRQQNVEVIIQARFRRAPYPGSIIQEALLHKVHVFPFQVTICDRPDQVCDNDLDSPYGQGTTVCKQLFRTHKLLAIDNGGEVVVDTFELPSACVCNYRSSFDLGFRSAWADRDIQCSASEITEPIASKFHDLIETTAATESTTAATSSADPADATSGGGGDDVPVAPSTVDPAGLVVVVESPGAEAVVLFEPEPCGTGANEGFFRICEETSENGYYPEKEMRKLLIRHPTFRSPDHFNKLFGKPCEFAESLTKFRIGFELTESPLCTSFESYIFPRVAKNIKGVWRYIVNTKDYRQGVTIETCHPKAIGKSTDR